MKTHEANDETSIRALLGYLNACHDGVVRRISFIKDRDYTNEGDVFWPTGSEAWKYDMARCSIEMEILLNSYAGATPKQVVLLQFEAVCSFRFCQEDAFDYSFIYEIVLDNSGENGFEFLFRMGWAKQVEALRVVCSKIVCVELGQ
jgi:hypothetical protein